MGVMLLLCRMMLTMLIDALHRWLSLLFVGVAMSALQLHGDCQNLTVVSVLQERRSHDVPQVEPAMIRRFQ